MDHFGIGLAVRAVAGVFFQSARQSGRTTSMLESLKDGDRVVFSNTKEADRIKRLCAQRELKVECITIPPSSAHRLFESRMPEGRTVLDHSWVEAYYTQAIERAQTDIDRFQRETSGVGTAHLETRLSAEMHRKWQS